MKTFCAFLIILFPFTLAYGQTTGISVQGIARDADKSALVDETLIFTFDIQDASGGTTYYKENVTIKTDSYGVFSHIIGTGNQISAEDFIDIPFRQVPMKLIITVDYRGTPIEVSNAPFQYAPYAISAENGVPTGTIVAFAGTAADVPAGWVLCDGQDISALPGTKNLIALLGSNMVPDLQGMFLRGTGTSPVNGEAGPALGATQDDGFESHIHTGQTSTNGVHRHKRVTNDQAGTSGDGAIAWNNVDGTNANNQTVWVDPAGDHNHTLTTNSTGINETRPVNYGVNYIIKL